MEVLESPSSYDNHYKRKVHIINLYNIFIIFLSTLPAIPSHNTRHAHTRMHTLIPCLLLFPGNINNSIIIIIIKF